MTEDNQPHLTWQQINVHFSDRSFAEPAATEHLGPAMRDAEAAGPVNS